MVAVIEMSRNEQMLTQAGQDALWSHYQNQSREVFDLSYPRLRFLAERCCLGDRVLNIGVGSGYLERLLVNRGVDVYSLDPSEDTVRRLQIELHMGDRAKQGYSQSIPFPTAYFHKIIMTEVLEHLRDDDLAKTLTEVRRVLISGGFFVGTVPFRENLEDNIVTCPSCRGRFHRWGHHQSFGKGDLLEQFKKNGFKDIKVVVRAFPDWSTKKPKAFLRALFRGILGRMGEQIVGPNIFFSAQK